MKRLLLLPIVLFAFNASAMDYLEEAEELFERSEASKVEEASQSPFASQQQEDETSESEEKDEGDYTWHSDLDEHEWTERYGCKYCPEGDCKQTEMFDCKGLLKNPYWQKVLNMQQKDKNDILAEMLAQSGGDPHYWRHRRCHIAAAVCAGANPDTKSKSTYDGWKRPLFNLLHQDPPMIKLLLEHGADPEVNISRSFFHRHPAICEARTLQEAELLFEHGANPHVKCDMEPNILYEVLVHDRGETPELVELYLQKGVDPNESDERGYTALHRLAQPIGYFKTKDIRRMGEALIEHGVDVNAKNAFGLSAEDLLIRRRKNYVECSEDLKGFCRKQCERVDVLLEIIREQKKDNMQRILL